MSTYYAVFPETTKGRLAVITLVNEGVPTDDISLVMKGNAEGTQLRGNGDHLADATSFVGRQDDPVIDNPFPESAGKLIDEEDQGEAPFGGGAATDDLNDSAESVDQTEDPQWLAETEFLEMPKNVAQLELGDLDKAVNTGFPSDPTEMKRPTRNPLPPVEDFERSIEAVTIPGFGLVMGSGSLATAALDYGDGDPSDDVATMMSHFREEGVPDDIASRYLEALQKGEAIMAVGLVPGEVEAPLVETVMARFGAHDSGLYDAPRF
ncbi:MAG: hypothetical protein QOJ65_838 [Fimbriimonadaceae bacterium]|jgi:hypothetical protein|nr:hypothetical protein [Fimbriimonadaceae bacterium]